MGHENKQMKEPTLFQRIPPMALHLLTGSKEASIFHFREESGGGHHISLLMDGSEMFLGTDLILHLRQFGFLRTSLHECGNGSCHPLIHQHILVRIKSWSCSLLFAVPLNIRLFLSFHNVHGIMKKTTLHIFLKKLFEELYCHCMNKSFQEEGITHFTSHNASHHNQSDLAVLQ